VKRRSDREIWSLLMGLRCLWGGTTLVREAMQAGPGGQVVRQSKSDHMYTTPSRKVLGEGLLLGGVGAIGVTYGLSRFRLR